ncbi:amidoligase family protein [Oscillospiraceae bacterium OttesenSCG-928-F05]|nr:amidoligase family protein [Oscillospiraceae bacterium OttesenSCG-928-F05]
MTDTVNEIVAEVEDVATITCEHCLCAVHPDDTFEVSGQILCPQCFDDETITCDSCGSRIFETSNAGNRDTVLCHRCYDDYYTHCDDCNTLIRQSDTYGDEDEDGEYCYDCHMRRQENRVIRGYDYKPDPIFYGDSIRNFGIELEIDGAGENHDKARDILDVANYRDEHIYCKHDGSLSDGFELVSHPMSLEYHCNDMPWRGLLNKALDLDYRSHQTDTCGLHIHVSRDAFGETRSEQEDVIARVLFFIETHWLEVLRFSRRTEYNMSRWAARYGRKDNPKDVLDTAKQSGARYACVNLTNSETIEFRMFRGTLKYNTLIATLQFVDRICDVALSMSDHEIQSLSWTQFVTDITEPELIQYLKERRLYVNEPLQSEEEL